MPKTLRLQFDPNQPHQLDAVESVARLFEGLPRFAAAFALGDDVVPNLPRFEALSEAWLYDNLRAVQQANDISTELVSAPFDFAHGKLAVDEGLVLEGAGNESWRYPSFTVEMETGTGKTYVYLRTIYALRQRYGFSKFIIVVPSIAIYEGVIKNIKITRAHFRALFGNETVNLIEYDGSRLSQLRAFAASTAVEVLVITLDSFNKASNVIFRPSEKLPGERLPYQFLQETRPILILDEPQNMESEKSYAALRTLHPLFALRYSATHRTSPNLVYRLTPFDAYRLNLVKKIQVYGVTERDNFNQPFLGLASITREGGLKAQVRAYVEDRGRLRETTLTLKHGDDLFEKTHRDEHRGGYTVVDINAAGGFVEFANGLHLTLKETIGPSRPEIFRAQIRKTLEQHMEMQARLADKGLKVLSLFFIDRVANYTSPDGLIRRIFDEEYERIKGRFPFYTDLRADQVRSSYFAQRKPKKGETEGEALDTESRNKTEREAEKAAFALIMRDKERLLSFDEPVCFIFAHSALKEGWDNPNVFQICTLNQTVSEIKKRQEIGRGLRLAVDQTGERVFDDDVNVLSVIANESYQSYASRLQAEYVEAGQAPPPKPTNAARVKAHRNDAIFAGQQAFRDFWARLQRHTTYRITVDTPALVAECVERINARPIPQAVIVIERGAFVVTEYTLALLSAGSTSCKLRVAKRDTLGDESVITQTCTVKTDLAKTFKDERLRGFKIVEIVDDGDNGANVHVVFGNGERLYTYAPLQFQSEQGQRPGERALLTSQEHYPVFNLLDRVAKETGLTRPTVNAIFQGLSAHKKQSLFANPEGFVGLFTTEVINALADHVAARIEFTVTRAPAAWGYDLEDLFPPEREFPQKELIPASSAGLYDQVQIDSEVEERFVRYRLNDDGEVLFYFKFPPRFRIEFPRIIGNYNPDWGIARYGPDRPAVSGAERRVVLELVRETKGSEELATLQFPHEKRKIACARKHFAAVGVDFRVVSDQTVTWWRAESAAEQLELRTGDRC
ncbi:MAG: DEAD/DEAH box helicase family protein [Anaerolineae bacterium]|nr:DEAD/DEAH box helicase family protein [Anaerolineae bacterium]